MLFECEFSERQFEFCFNHEFVNKNRAFLNEMPYVPTQNEEGDVSHGNAGYDVRYYLREDDRVFSLFFQHKVPSLLTTPSRKYPREWEFHGDEYYYFKLHRKRNSGYEQHNMLVNLEREGYDVFYSSPIIIDRVELNQFFCDGTLIDNCIFVRPADIGIIEDREPHRVSYKGRNVAGFSSRSFREIPSSKIHDILASTKKVKICEEYFSHLLNGLVKGCMYMANREIKLPKTINNKTILSQIKYLLEKYYNISWFIF